MAKNLRDPLATQRYSRFMPEQIPQTFEEAFKRIQQLAADFKANEQRYLASDYQEAEVRKDFIDKFWTALGWDVNHDFQTNPYEQEVKVERSVSIAASQRRADYAFYLKPNFRDVRFYVEAKKPSVGLATTEHYFQVVRYGWSSKTPLAVIQDFQQFHVLDCRYKPKVETILDRAVATYHYSDYANPEKFKQIYWLFSREAVAGGSLEKRAAELPKLRGKGAQRSSNAAAKPVDEDFLETLDEHRTDLARAFKSKNPRLDSETLTELAQRTLDRLVFLRFLEDKGIEAQRLVERFGAKGMAWEDFVAVSRRLDGIYNGIVFKDHAILDKPGFRVDEDIFKGICGRLTEATTPYDFNFIPIHILGSIYERFLGKVIVATDKRVRVEEKPEVRKAGGVYYTPEYIVRYIVENTVGKLIAGKKPEQIAEMRFADIACGSGSFLLGVFDLLLQHHGIYYNNLSDTERTRAVKRGDCIEHDGCLYTSLRKKREILVNNIYGVDIDAQAVEVCQLSLYLKLLKDETTVSAHQYLMDFEHVAQMKKLLPDLSKNIVCGNSLIGRDFSEGQLFASAEERRLNPMNFEDAFPHIFPRQPGMVRESEAAYEVGRTISREGGRRVYPSIEKETHGFDAVVGNPPYVRPHNLTETNKRYFWKHYKTFTHKSDLYCCFIEQATRLLKQGGFFSYIVSHGWLRLNSFQEVRKLFLENHRILQLVELPEKVFADAQVATGIFVVQKEASCERSSTNIEIIEGKLAESGPTFVMKRRIPQATFHSTFQNVFDLSISPETERIKEKMRVGPTIGSLFRVCFGLKTGDDAKFLHRTKGLHREDRPLLRGDDVKRYTYEHKGEYVWYVPQKMRAHRSTARPGECERFEQPKVLVKDTTADFAGTYDGNSFYVKDVLIVIPHEGCEAAFDLRYVTGVVNSQALRFYYRTTFKTIHVQCEELSSLPLPALDLKQAEHKARHDAIAKLVEQMVEAKTALSKAQTDKDRNYYEAKCAALDRQIDALVYELYGLTEKEIEIVKGA